MGISWLFKLLFVIIYVLVLRGLIYMTKGLVLIFRGLHQRIQYDREQDLALAKTKPNIEETVNVKI